MNRHFNPDDMIAPMAVYSHGVEVPAGARTVYVAGQVGTGKDGKTPAGFVAQAELAFANVVSVLAGAGMDLSDVVKFNIYLTRREDVAAWRDIVATKDFGGQPPSSTLVIVASLVSPDFLVEIAAVADKA